MYKGQWAENLLRFQAESESLKHWLLRGPEFQAYYELQSRGKVITGAGSNFFECI
jgi:hypothetical protein